MWQETQSKITLFWKSFLFGGFLLFRDFLRLNDSCDFYAILAIFVIFEILEILLILVFFSKFCDFLDFCDFTAFAIFCDYFDCIDLGKFWR